jgi:gliding motility-associated lipoprotein GldH
MSLHISHSHHIKPYFFTLFFIVSFAFYACDSQRVFEGYYDLPEKKWVNSQVIHFDFEIQDTQAPYNLYCNIRNTLSYPYYNLYIVYELKDSTNKVLVEKMIENNLMHPKTGEPFGKGIGDLFDHRFLLLSKYKFVQRGKYRLSLRQYMRMQELPEIVAVGCRVEKAVEN